MLPKTTCGCVVVLVLSAHYEKEEDYCNARLEVLVPSVDEKGPAQAENTPNPPKGTQPLNTGIAERSG